MLNCGQLYSRNIGFKVLKELIPSVRDLVSIAVNLLWSHGVVNREWSNPLVRKQVCIPDMRPRK